MKKILIMEDDKKIAAALAIRLEAAGYEVLTSPDGFGGLKIVLGDRPDLLLMDIWMPVGTGFSVAQRLRTLGLTDIPVIFITASKLKGVTVDAKQLAGNTPPPDAAATLSALETELLAADVSQQTHDSIMTQIETQKKPAKPDPSTITGLLLGSPEFQKR